MARKYKKKPTKKAVYSGSKIYHEFIKDKYLNQEVHVVASGPSLIGFDYDRLKGKNVIAVNHAWKFVEHDFCIYTDKGFALRESPGIIDKTVCVGRFNKETPNIVVFDYAKTFSMNPEDGIWNRHSSGSLGVCAALQGGASMVYLYGFDCRFFNSDEVKKIVAHNGDATCNLKLDYYAHCSSGVFKHERDKSTDEIVFRQTIQLFARFPVKKIINMSKFSAIPYFEKSESPYID